MANSSDTESVSRQDQPGPEELRDEEEENDRRMIYFVIGGILLAFTIGFSFLVVAMVIDWK